MSFIKYAAPVAALLGAVSAQDSPCSFDKALTVSAAGDVSSIAACSTISGNIVFATGAASPSLALAGVEEITGDWTYEKDDTVTSIQAPMLKKISGKILFSDLKNLHDIGLMSLQSSGDVTITNCASLADITTGVGYAEAGAIELGNTYLSTIEGFGNLTKVDSLSISGNPLLSEINMNIASVRAIDIGSNEVQNNGLAVTFDNLTVAMDHIVVQNATNVSFAKLETVTNNFEMIFNNFDTFAAPNLTYAGGIVLNSNPQLTNISLPQLTMLNGTNSTFLIANNTKLETIDGFPKLTDCEGGVTFEGAFKNASVDGLQKVAGAMYVTSTEDISSTCDDVNNLKSHQVIRGKAQCSGKNPQATGSTSKSGSGTGSGSSSSSSGAAAFVDIPALPTLSAGLGAALLQFLLSF